MMTRANISGCGHASSAYASEVIHTFTSLFYFWFICCVAEETGYHSLRSR